MAKKIGDYRLSVGIDVDNNGLSQLKQSLSSIRKMTTKDLLNFGKPNQGAEKLAKELVNIQELAGQVEAALEKSYNVKLNNYNVAQFNKELSKSGNLVRNFQESLKGLKMGGTIQNDLLHTQLSYNLQMRESIGLLDRFATTLGNTARYLVATRALNSITGAINGAWSYAKDLNESLNNIRIVTGKSNEEMEKFAKSANIAAKALRTQTTNYTNASLIYYQQGLSDKEVKARTETTIKAANITKQSAEDVSEQLTAVWNGYKVAADETEVYIDKMAAVAANSASDLEELSSAMQKVASAASSMGINIDQLIAQISTIVSVTREDPSSVGTALKTIFARMGDLAIDGEDEFGTKLGDVSGKLQQMGINILDNEGQMRDLGEVIEETAAKWNTWTDSQRQAAAVALAGKRQYNNLIALFDNWNSYQENLTVSQQSQGTLAQQQSVYLDSIEASLNRLSAASESLYDNLINDDAMKFLIDFAANFVKGIDNIITALGGGQTAFLALGSVAAAVLQKQIGSGLTFVTHKIADFNRARQNRQTGQQIINDMRNKSAQQSIEETSSPKDYSRPRYDNSILVQKDNESEQDFLKRVERQRTMKELYSPTQSQPKQSDPYLDRLESVAKEVGRRNKISPSEAISWMGRTENREELEKIEKEINVRPKIQPLQFTNNTLTESQEIQSSFQKEIDDIRKQIPQEVDISEIISLKGAGQTNEQIIGYFEELNKKGYFEEQERKSEILNKLSNTQNQYKELTKKHEQDIVHSAELRLQYEKYLTEEQKKQLDNNDKERRQLQQQLELLTLQKGEQGKILKIASQNLDLDTSELDQDQVNEIVDNFQVDIKDAQDSVGEISPISTQTFNSAYQKIAEGIAQSENISLNDAYTRFSKGEFDEKKVKQITGELPEFQSTKDILSNLQGFFDNNQVAAQSGDFSSLRGALAQAQNAFQNFDIKTDSVENLNKILNRLKVIAQTTFSRVSDDLEQVREDTVETNEQIDQLGRAIDRINNEQDKIIEDAQLKEVNTAIAGIASSSVGIVTSLVSMGVAISNILNDENLSGFEKFQNIVSSALINIPMLAGQAVNLASQLKVLRNANKSVTASIREQIVTLMAHPAVPIIIAIVAAVLALGATFAIANAALHKNEAAFKKATEAANQAKEAFDGVKKSYDDLIQSIEDYKGAQDAIEKMARGTDEWKQAIADSNQQVLDLMSNYKGLSKYVSNVNGRLTISEEGLEKLQEQEQEKVNNAFAYNMQMQAKKNEAASKADIETLANSSSNSYRAVNNTGSALAGAGWGALAGTIVGLAVPFIGPLIGPIVGTVVGGAIGASISEVTQQDRREEFLEDAANEIIKSNHSLTKEELKKELKNSYSEDMLAMLDDSEIMESIRDLADSIDANTKAIQVQKEQQVAAIFSSNKSYQNSRYQSQLNAIGIKTISNVRATEEYAHWNEENDEFTHNRYAELMGLTYVKNKVGKGSFKDSSGKEFDVEDTHIREYLASVDILENASKNINKLNSILSKISSKSGGKSIINLAGGKDSTSLLDLTSAEVSNLSTSKSSNELLRYFGLTESEIRQLGYESGKDFYDAVQDSITNYKRDEKEVAYKLFPNLKVAFNQINTDDLTLETKQNIANSLEAAFEGGGYDAAAAFQDFSSELINSGKYTTEQLTKIFSIINGLDVYDSNALNTLKNELQDQKIVIDDSITSWATYQNSLQSLANSVIYITQKFDTFKNTLKSCGEILDKLEVGKTISEEDFENLKKYNNELSKFFVATRNGYKYLGGASEELKNNTYNNIADFEEWVALQKEANEDAKLLSKDSGYGGETTNVAKATHILLNKSNYQDLIKLSISDEAALNKALVNYTETQRIADMTVEEVQKEFGLTEEEAAARIETKKAELETYNNIVNGFISNIDQAITNSEDPSKLDERLQTGIDTYFATYGRMIQGAALGKLDKDDNYYKIAQSKVQDMAIALGINAEAMWAYVEATVEGRDKTLETAYSLAEAAENAQILSKRLTLLQTLTSKSINKNYKDQLKYYSDIVKVANNNVEFAKQSIIDARTSALKEIEDALPRDLKITVEFDENGKINIKKLEDALESLNLDESIINEIKGIALNGNKALDTAVNSWLDAYEEAQQRGFEKVSAAIESLSYKFELEIDRRELDKSLFEIQKTWQNVSKAQINAYKLLDSSSIKLEQQFNKNLANNAVSMATQYIEEANIIRSILASPGAQGEYYYKDANGQEYTDEEALRDLWKTALDGIRSSGEELYSYLQEIIEAYQASLEEASDKFEKQNAIVERYSKLLNNSIQVTKLLYNTNQLVGKNFEKLDSYYNNQDEAYQNAIKMQETQLQFWKSAQDELLGYDAKTGKYTKQIKDLSDAQRESLTYIQEQYQAVADNWSSTVSDRIANLNTQFEDTINSIFETYYQNMSGVASSYMDEEWTYITEQSEKYLDNINAAYGIQQLSYKYTEAINKTNSQYAQQKLNKAMQEQLQMLREKDKLTKYDLDRAQKKYELLEKELTLEEARNSATTMRLRRDAQGNYSYVYTADEDEINKLEQEISGLENDLYNLDKKEYNSNLNEIRQAYNDFISKYVKAVQSGDEKLAKLIMDNYFGEDGIITNLINGNLAIQDNLQESVAINAESLNDASISVENTVETVSSTLAGFVDKIDNDYIQELVTSIGKVEKNYVEKSNSIKGAASTTQAAIDAESDAMKDMYNMAVGTDGKSGLTKAVDDLSKAFLDQTIEIDKVIKSLTGEDGKGGLLASLLQIENAYERINKEVKTFNGSNPPNVTIPADIDNKNKVDLTGEKSKTLQGIIDNIINIDKTPNVSFEEKKKKISSELANLDMILPHSGISGVNEFLNKRGNPDLERLLSQISEKLRKELIYNLNSIYMPMELIDNYTVHDIGRIEKYGFTNIMDSLTAEFVEGVPLVSTDKVSDLPINSNKYIAGQIYKYQNELYTTDGKTWYKLKIADYGIDQAQEEEAFEKFKQKLLGLDTGGYTGEWGDEGRLALLHQKELILNKEDTANILNAVTIIRDIMANVRNSAGNLISSFEASLPNNSQVAIPQTQSSLLEQTVHIEADFPNVTDRNEIQEAFNNLVNLASQRANEKGRD